MACSSCGARIRRLAKQYPTMDVKPAVTRSASEIKEVKQRLKDLALYSIPVEETNTKYTVRTTDLSTIHTV